MQSVIEQQEATTIDVGPTPAGLLQDMRNRSGMLWPVILGEMLDNSIDAGANHIELVFGAKPKSLTVIDNGIGCGCIEAMLTIGKHHRTATTRLGRYGVGLKDAAVSMWGKLAIITTYEGVTTEANLDWEAFSKQKHWRIPTPLIRQDSVSRGTIIRFDGIKKPLPEDYQRLADNVGYTFGPAIRDGSQILLSKPNGKTIVCKAYEPPTLDDVIEGDITVVGKQVRIRVGIVKPGTGNIRPGLSVTHHHRVILDRSHLIVGSYSIANVCGTVHLSDDWKLSTHKDEITQHKEELAAAVTDFCRPVLEKAQRATEVVESAALSSTLSAEISGALKQINKIKKGSRGRGNKVGSVKPTGTGSPHQDAASKQPGMTMADSGNAKKGAFVIDWLKLEGEVTGNVVGGNRIELNENLEPLVRLRSTNNIPALRAVCIGLLVDDAIERNMVQKVFPGFKEEAPGGTPFSMLMARMLSSIREQEAAKSEAT